ncbi:enoyl-CoA hydratase/isomerase family protein [Georgenia halophila]|uniref:3-hydroxyisobutyryl-CoA hydrolase n=1 Tax=Georgenia halophila TaxID=620889 RepID=A0ABP8LIF3_9MICO
MSVRSWVDGRTGRIELDRPQALNALDLDMIRSLHQVLDAWRDDDTVGSVVVTGAGRAFCAGGDVRSAREAVLDGRHDDAATFFREEYALNRTIAEYPKPYVAVIDGAALGGGIGVSVHGDARVVTENAVLAMPETAIGFAPDVGTSHVLSHLDGDRSVSVGRYLAMTGARLGPADALAVGLATHYVPSSAVDRLLAGLARDGFAVLDDHVARPGEPGTLAEVRDAVDSAFGVTTAGEILARLDTMAAEAGGTATDTWAASTATALRTMSPTSLVVALELLAAGRDSDLRTCLGNERRAAAWLVARPDFAEGVRAVLVDKDRSPTWSPATIEAVDVEEVRRALTAT